MRHALACIVKPHEEKRVLAALDRARRRDVRHSEENYQGYIEDLNPRNGPDADQPHRAGALARRR
jgi:hypothetical protein